jgi:DNA-binding MarR family transcriptional regulator
MARARLPHDGELFFKLVRVVNLTARPFVETLARQHRLSLAEWRVMIVLASHPGSAAHEIAELIGLDKMSISRAIAGLDRQRRLVKRIDPADARRTLLELSAAGRQLYEAVGAAGRLRELQLFAGLDAADKAQLERLVDRLIGAVDAPAAGAAGAPARRSRGERSGCG